MKCNRVFWTLSPFFLAQGSLLWGMTGHSCLLFFFFYRYITYSQQFCLLHKTAIVWIMPSGPLYGCTRLPTYHLAQCKFHIFQARETYSLCVAFRHRALLNTLAFCQCIIANLQTELIDCVRWCVPKSLITVDKRHVKNDDSISRRTCFHREKFIHYSY